MTTLSDRNIIPLPHDRTENTLWLLPEGMKVVLGGIPFRLAESVLVRGINVPFEGAVPYLGQPNEHSEKPTGST